MGTAAAALTSQQQNRFARSAAAVWSENKTAGQGWEAAGGGSACLIVIKLASLLAHTAQVSVSYTVLHLGIIARWEHSDLFLGVDTLFGTRRWSSSVINISVNGAWLASSECIFQISPVLGAAWTMAAGCQSEAGGGGGQAGRYYRVTVPATPAGSPSCPTITSRLSQHLRHPCTEFRPG